MQKSDIKDFYLDSKKYNKLLDKLREENRYDLSKLVIEAIGEAIIYGLLKGRKIYTDV